LYPGHYSVRHGSRQDYNAFIEDELRFRRAMRYPPEVFLVNVVVRGRSQTEALAHAARLARHLGDDTAPYRLLGPAPAPLERLRGEYRAQFFLKGTRRSAMRDALRRAFEAEPASRRHAFVDVDPQSML
jgi:primosomal protein N' (replication factor Y)